MISALKDFFKILQTKIGLMFAFIVPVLFTIVWLTGYDGATERLDRLSIGIVNQDESERDRMAEAIQGGVPYRIEQYSSLPEAQEQMNDGAIGMIVSVPENFASDAEVGEGELTYYINQANSDIAKAILEGSAIEISSRIGSEMFNDINNKSITSNVVKTNDISNFAVSMLPMILGFITYIAVMTMNIQLNLSSMMLKRNYGKWQIFGARQFLLLIVSVLASLVVTSVAMLFVDPVASFWEMWGFHILVYMACICVTQMTFALFGGLAALVNVALVPFQLMTAGNIIPTEMLSPFYRNIGDFLPASNAIHGYVRLIYSGASITSIVVNLAIIAVITWGVTLARTAFDKRPKIQADH